MDNQPVGGTGQKPATNDWGERPTPTVSMTSIVVSNGPALAATRFQRPTARWWAAHLGVGVAGFLMATAPGLRWVHTPIRGLSALAAGLVTSFAQPPLAAAGVNQTVVAVAATAAGIIAAILASVSLTTAAGERHNARKTLLMVAAAAAVCAVASTTSNSRQAAVAVAVVFGAAAAAPSVRARRVFAFTAGALGLGWVAAVVAGWVWARPASTPAGVVAIAMCVAVAGAVHGSVRILSHARPVVKRQRPAAATMVIHPTDTPGFDTGFDAF